MKIVNRTKGVVNTVFGMKPLYVKKGWPCEGRADTQVGPYLIPDPFRG